MTERNVRARIHAALGPGIHKVSASREALCEARAAQFYAQGVKATGGNRASARLAEKDERTIRDRCNAARGIAFQDLLLSLDRDGLYTVADLLCDFADEQAPRSERTGSDG